MADDWLECECAVSGPLDVALAPANSFQRETDTGEKRGRLSDARSGDRSDPCSVASLTATVVGPSANDKRLQVSEE